LGQWQIILKENDKKILTGSGKTVLVALYKFIGLCYLKGLFCENDFSRIGYNFGKRFIKKEKK
jgi:hypothetical protein